MATTITLSQNELKRIADLAYDGKAYRAFLANNSVSPVTVEATYTAWAAKELAATNGYAAVTGTITASSGAYDATDARYEFPVITASFAATGGSFTYDTVVFRIGTEAGVVGILVESPAITLNNGQARAYRITLGQND